jgi:hypothetical protein
MSGFLLILAGLLVLPAAAGTAVLLGLVRGSGWWVTVLAVLAALLVMALEARVLLGRLGRIFEATDPASVAPAEVL